MNFELKKSNLIRNQNHEILYNEYSPSLPSWATLVSNKAGLIEVEINDESPGFHSIIEELSTEIQPGIIGVKAGDLCQRLSIEMVETNEEN